VSFSSRIRQCFVLPRFDLSTFSSSANNFAHAQTLSRMISPSGRMNFAQVNIEFFTGCKKIKQRRISFALGYLRMILWKISTTISIKHRILATFNENKFNSDSLYMPLIDQCNINWFTWSITLHCKHKASFKCLPMYQEIYFWIT
jgi:ribosomal protein S18